MDNQKLTLFVCLCLTVPLTLGLILSLLGAWHRRQRRKDQDNEWLKW